MTYVTDFILHVRNCSIKTFICHIFFTAICSFSSAQVMPLGLYVDIDGKVRFWESETNRNGNLDDTVVVRSDLSENSEIIDLRNFIYDYLTLIEAPKWSWTCPNNLDPSSRFDTNQRDVPQSFNHLTDFNLPSTLFIIQDTFPHSKTLDYSHWSLFQNEEIGWQLTDSIHQLVSKQLFEFVKAYPSFKDPDLAYQTLYLWLSEPDTVIDKIPVCDFLVDKFIHYYIDTIHNRATGIGYHWNSGIEVDEIQFNKHNNVSYFSRTYLGTAKVECSFYYTKHQQVKQVIKNEYSYQTNTFPKEIDTLYSTKISYDYNKDGELNQLKLYSSENDKPMAQRLFIQLPRSKNTP